jgi:hypothetical protein
MEGAPAPMAHFGMALAAFNASIPNTSTSTHSDASIVQSTKSTIWPSVNVYPAQSKHPFSMAIPVLPVQMGNTSVLNTNPAYLAVEDKSSIQIPINVNVLTQVESFGMAINVSHVIILNILITEPCNV